MPKLLERSIACIDERLILLAPADHTVPRSFTRVEHDFEEHATRLTEVQRLRGDVYFNDGAVSRQELSADGRHQTPEDEKSWHLLVLNKERQVSACAWYLLHPHNVSPEQLRVRNCPAGMRHESSGGFWKAVKAELVAARKHHLGYAELGGWAVSEKSRCTSDALLLALATYSLARVLGGALGMTTATIRHSSSTILRRLGGLSLEAEGVEVQPYFDPGYQCEMELLRFDSRRPNPKYAFLVDKMLQKLNTVAVIGGREETREQPVREVALAGAPQVAAA